MSESRSPRAASGPREWPCPAIAPASAALRLVALALLAGCDGGPAERPVAGRWYTPAQLADGEALFARHCAGCHGLQAQGTPDWRVRDADGRLRPPPLDGSAHAWHHPLAELQATILRGNLALGGDMPGFEGVLDPAGALATIAYFQSLWPDETYARWVAIDQRSP